MSRNFAGARKFKGQLLVSIRLLLDDNPRLIAACCNGKLPYILQRLSPKILGNVEKNAYVYNCFEEVTNFLAESVTTSLELIAARIKNVKATNRDSPVQYSTFVANDQVERSIVILPSMLTLINSRCCWIICVKPHWRWGYRKFYNIYNL